ncbi:zinc ABC transporter substrate-binding protein ZnuA [Biformimicrobium ophioploci]|uniref:High-affinity zinc uptake system protein ZnuA n=1 Tax=Biformimicrobium ophioploci TaxID=3036711 RepID=A0ABQ6LV66_9GAMM|nr:zinc ABC transporter substrate-binding protein ZnuA [Microbulbifer sp. NKW57]
MASIRPLAMLAEAVAEPADEVQVMQRGGDPHAGALRPSQRMLLKRADLVLWVGPELESSLARLLGTDPDRVLRASAVEGLAWPGSAGVDPHLWLRPANMALIAAALAERLARLNPASAATYRSNAEAFAAEMTLWETRINERLQGFQGHTLVSTHEAYGHFFAGSGLVLLSLDEGGHGHHGAATLLKLRREVRGPGCFLGESGGSPAEQRLASQLGLHFASMDPLGNNLAPTSDIAQLYASILDATVSCLTESAATR